MMYTQRLLSFLKDNRGFKFTPAEIASVWKRKQSDVNGAAMNLFLRDKIKYSKKGYISAK